MYFAQNITYLRSQHPDRPSQQKLGDTLGVKKSTLAAWESGRAKPSFEDLLRLAGYFGVSADELLREDLAVKRSRPWLKEDNLRVLVTTVSKDEEQENIEFVPVKAIGGYTEGYGDVDYISALPNFNLPFLMTDRKYRAFPFQGDSMPPLREGAIVFGEYVEYWERIKSGTICLVVTKDEGVVLKKVFNYLDEKGVLVLKSLNERYAPYPVRREDILEVWLFAGFFDREFPAF
jgi:transcriptional regulator with XRE-family HTH domain